MSGVRSPDVSGYCHPSSVKRTSGLEGEDCLGHASRKGADSMRVAEVQPMVASSWVGHGPKCQNEEVPNAPIRESRSLLLDKCSLLRDGGAMLSL